MINKNLLLRRMKEAGYTQKRLAETIGISQTTMSLKVNGVTPFNTREAREICGKLGIARGSEKAAVFLAETSQKRDEN